MSDPVTARPAICLNMIVKNEAHVPARVGEIAQIEVALGQIEHRPRIWDAALFHSATTYDPLHDQRHRTHPLVQLFFFDI